METKKYIPKSQARVIPINAAPLDEWIPLDMAARLFITAKHPNGILPKSLVNKANRGELPDGCFTCGPTGW